MEAADGEGIDRVPDGCSAAEKRRLRRAASRLRECYLAFLAGLAGLLSLASVGAE
jgi:hypothetical protein